jgi:hypothetical protein
VSPSATSSPAAATTFHTLATISARISSAMVMPSSSALSLHRIQSRGSRGGIRGASGRRLRSALTTRTEQELPDGEEVPQEEGSQEERRQPRQAP